jgi:large repetitive protein
MSRRVAIAGMIVSGLLLAFTVTLVAGISLPGPPVRDWLGIGEPPEPALCEFGPGTVGEAPGRLGPGHWRRQRNSPDPSPEVGAVTIGRYVYLVGGQLRAGTEKILLRYDPHTDRYRREPDAPVAIDHPVVASHDGEVILASGYIDGAVSTPRMWAYSPRSREWRELPAMRTSRGAAAGAVVGDKLYVAGGVNQFGNEYQPYSFLEIYDFKTGEWHDGPDMPTARHHFGVAVVDGKLYFAGGRQPRDESLNAFEMFDPRRDRWRRLAPMPYGAGAPGVAAIDGKIVVTGGANEVLKPNDAGTIYRAAIAYDPRTREWARLPDMNHARHGHVSVTASDRVYVFRGAPCPGYGEMSSVESLPASAVR